MLKGAFNIYVTLRGGGGLFVLFVTERDENEGGNCPMTMTSRQKIEVAFL